MILTLFLASGQQVRAEASYVLLEPLPKISGVPQPTTCVDKNGKQIVDKSGTPVTNDGSFIKCIGINSFISYIFKFVIALAVFLATVMIIWGGFEYMFSESFTKKNDAKQKFADAGFGLAVALCSYLILQTIDPRLVQINTTVPEIKIKIDEETTGYLTSVEQDLRKVSAQTRETVLGMETEIKDLEKRKAELEQILATAETSEGTGDALLELHEVTQKLNDLKAKQIQIIANGNMSGYYRNAIGYLQNGGGTDEAVKNAVNSIKADYEKYSKDPSIVANPAAAEDLKFQEVFRLQQINEESYLHQKIEAYQAALIKYGPNGATVKPLTAELQAIRSTATENLKFFNGETTTSTQTDLTRAKKDQILSEEYKAVAENRVKLIRLTVGSTTVK